MSSGKIKDDFLTCPICCDLFREPRILSCLHTFCLDCITKYAETKDHYNKVECPTCRQPSNCAAASLKSNFYVSSLLESVTGEASEPAPRCEPPLVQSYTGQAQHPEVPSNEDSAKCDLCTKPEVENYCPECEEKMCGACSKIHTRSKASSAHVIVPIQNVTDEVVVEMKLRKAEEGIDKLSIHPEDCMGRGLWGCKRRRHQRGRWGRRSRGEDTAADPDDCDCPRCKMTPEQQQEWREQRKAWKEQRKLMGDKGGWGRRFREHPPPPGRPIPGQPPPGPPPPGPPPHGPPPHGPPPHDPPPDGPPPDGPPPDGLPEMTPEHQQEWREQCKAGKEQRKHIRDKGGWGRRFRERPPPPPGRPITGQPPACPPPPGPPPHGPPPHGAPPHGPPPGPPDGPPPDGPGYHRGPGHHRRHWRGFRR